MLENVPSKALFIRLSEGTVAPFTGAWIETVDIAEMMREGLSHPSRMRGLKQLNL